jgi:hypothetical protein
MKNGEPADWKKKVATAAEEETEAEAKGDELHVASV